MEDLFRNLLKQFIFLGTPIEFEQGCKRKIWITVLLKLWLIFQFLFCIFNIMAELYYLVYKATRVEELAENMTSLVTKALMITKLTTFLAKRETYRKLIGKIIKLEKGNQRNSGVKT